MSLAKRYDFSLAFSVSEMYPRKIWPEKLNKTYG
jgi:hypothetical protein